MLPLFHKFLGFFLTELVVVEWRIWNISSLDCMCNGMVWSWLEEWWFTLVGVFRSLAAVGLLPDDTTTSVAGAFVACRCSLVVLSGPMGKRVLMLLLLLVVVVVVLLAAFVEGFVCQTVIFGNASSFDAVWLCWSSREPWAGEKKD